MGVENTKKCQKIQQWKLQPTKAAKQIWNLVSAAHYEEMIMKRTAGQVKKRCFLAGRSYPYLLHRLSEEAAQKAKDKYSISQVVWVEWQLPQTGESQWFILTVQDWHLLTDWVEGLFVHVGHEQRILNQGGRGSFLLRLRYHATAFNNTSRECGLHGKRTHRRGIPLRSSVHWLAGACSIGALIGCTCPRCCKWSESITDWSWH